jgi:iron complex outermembrane receptor protein
VMKNGTVRSRLAIAAIFAAWTGLAHAQSTNASSPSALPEADVVGVSPLSGAGIDRDKIPANVQIMSGDEFDHRKSPDLMSAFSQGMPGVSIEDQAGNAYQRDFEFRGFVASPIPGTTEGLAVYQNGIRINEAFGDIVNWDFIPEGAIARTVLLPSSPIYGLNAVGGAVSIEMENGFTHPNTEIELRGGSFGREGLAIEAGHQFGNMAGYLALDTVHDHGWRQDSTSEVHRAYGDLGFRSDAAEYHLSLTAASNSFGAAAATPVEMLDQSWSSIYTIPQSTKEDMLFLTGTGSWKITDTSTIQANAYYRGFWQSHIDGNGTDAQNDGCPDPTLVCFPDINGNLVNLTTPAGTTVPATGNLADGSLLGEIDRSWTSSGSVGAAVQSSTATPLGDGRFNRLVAGASVDLARSRFTTTSELGTINEDQFPFVVGQGVFIDVPTGDVAPTGVSARNTYLGLFASDTFDLTSTIALTAGARYNIAKIALGDYNESDPDVAGSHRYSRLNPDFGATWAVMRGLTLYAGYAEANRAPTPLELACADPNRPCLIDNALVADPDLKQVISRTIETGARGKIPLGTGGAGLTWNAGLFQTQIGDDILHLTNTNNGLGYFANVGSTRRRGLEASVAFHSEDVNAYANVSLIDATYRTAVTLNSDNNPAADADADGNIFVVPGNHLPMVPRTRVKIGADTRVVGQWRVGADGVYVGPQYLVGDDSNQNPQMPGYTVFNLRSTLALGQNLELFAQIQNLFQRRYYTYGTFFETDTVPYLNLSDPRTFLPGAPRTFFFGIRMSI